MISRTLRLTLRRLRARGTYAAINVLGLAVGLTCCAFIGLYLIDELSWEGMHDNVDRIVRIVEDQAVDGRVDRLATTFGPLGPAVAADVPEVDMAVRVYRYGLLLEKGPGERFQEDNLLFVDSTFFEVFDFPLIAGDADTALDDPFSILLTESAASRYFGEDPALGQVIRARDDEAGYELTVTGVLADPPRNTHLQFEMLGPFSFMRITYGGWLDDPRNWEHPPMHTYALLHPEATPEEVEARMPALALRHMGESRVQTRSLHVEPLDRIRLHSGRTADLSPGSDIRYIYLFGVIAGIILVLACINFVNLETAQAARRMSEVGTRKALGATPGNLASQFLGETAVQVVLAAGLVVLLVEGLLPVFNGMSGKTLGPGAFLRDGMPLVLVAGTALVVLLAGGYPALFLSRLRADQALRARASSGVRPGGFRQGLVVFQFVVSIALLVGTAVVHRQLDFVRSDRLGFQKERVVIAPLRDLDNQFHHESLLAAWERLPGVESATGSSGMPGLEGGIYDWVVHPEGREDSLTLMVLTVDEDYAETYGLEVVAGRDFSRDRPSDATAGFMLNQAAAARLGWQPADAVGRGLSLGVWFNGHFDKRGTVVGVVRDFQYHSLHRAIDPIIFHILPESYYYDWVSARLTPGGQTASLAAMETAWAGFNPGRPFEYRFLDDQFDALYRSEARLAGLFGAFGLLAVLIAGLGLFGLAALSAEQRTKEIGVRKVLGASVTRLVGLLSRDLLRLVIVAFVIAAPVAWFALDRWLSGFVDQVSFPWLMLLAAGMGALAVAWLAVGLQALRAARADPVRSLRYE